MPTLIGLAATSMPSISGVSQAGIAIPNRAERRRGVAVYAGGDFKLYMGAASGALAIGTASVTGVVSTAVVQNRIRAQVGNGVRINASSALGRERGGRRVHAGRGLGRRAGSEQHAI